MSPQFRRDTQALLSNDGDFLVVDRKSKTVRVHSSKTEPSIIHALFIQAVQLKSPGLLHNLISSASNTARYNRYNSRATCCFNNVVIYVKGKLIVFGILPHTQCKPVDLALLCKKIRKWNCNPTE